MHIVRDNQSVEEYTREFFKLSHHTTDVIQDEKRVVELFVTGLDPAYIGIQTKDRSLEGVIEEAR